MSEAAINQPSPESNDSTQPAATNAAAAETAKPAKRTRCALTRKQQKLAERGRLVSRAAQKPPYLAALQTNGLQPVTITDLLEEITVAEGKGSEALGHGTDGKACTLEEGDSKGELLKDLRSFQNAARQSYEATQPLKLEEYLIGQRIGDSRAALEDNALTIIDKTNAERPGSTNTDMIIAAEAKLAKYNTDGQTQGTEKSLSAQMRQQRDNCFTTILQKTRKIQLAADRAWPFNVKGNAPIRKEFLLPLRRPFA